MLAKHSFAFVFTHAISKFLVDFVCMGFRQRFSGRILIRMNLRNYCYVCFAFGENVYSEMK